MNSRRVVLLAIVVLCGLIAALWVRRTYYYPITNRHAGGDVIVALGDSLTYGTGADRPQAWPAVIQQRYGISIVNRGVPGDTTADALQRLDKDVLALAPRIVVVLLGGNDMLQQAPREQMFANLRRIITEIQESGAMVLLVGLNGFPFDNGMGSEYARLARETGCAYVPNILRGIFTNAKLKSDQIHPNAAGYEIMADRIYHGLKPLTR